MQKKVWAAEVSQTCLPPTFAMMACIEMMGRKLRQFQWALLGQLKTKAPASHFEAVKMATQVIAIL